MLISQKISDKKSKFIFITSVIIVLLAGSIVTYLYFSNKHKQSEAGINYNPPTQEEKATGDAIKQSGSSGSDPAPQPTSPTDATDTRSIVGMEITTLDQSADTLYIRTLIQAVTSSGMCSLSMTGPGEKVYTATASVQAGPSSSTCMGFDISTASLSPGTWTVAISFQNDTLRGSTIRSATIK